MKKRLDDSVAVLIPSYDRPEMLEITLPRWFEAKCVKKVFVVAQSSSPDILKKYKEALVKFMKKGNIVYKLVPRRLGSVGARNVLLNMVRKESCKYALMVDDDHLWSNENCLDIMTSDLESDNNVGAIGGRVIVNGRREDPDFFLNHPLNLADLLSKLTGYVFLDIKHGPRYSQFLTPFFMVRKEILDENVRYNTSFDVPTGFREESDFQLRIRDLGYKLLHDPRIHIIHLATETGGNRPKMNMGKRMYWKARNHTIFIFEWNGKIINRIWYIALCMLILCLYRPWHLLSIVKGVNDGMRFAKQYTLNERTIDDNRSS